MLVVDLPQPSTARTLPLSTQLLGRVLDQTERCKLHMRHLRVLCWGAGGGHLNMMGLIHSQRSPLGSRMPKVRM